MNLSNLEALSLPLNQTLSTDGSSLWAPGVAKDVSVRDAVLFSVNTDEGRAWGNMRVVFDTKSWDVTELGLIYTDREFASQVREALAELGVTGKIGYSEQGMQGHNYVDFDVDAEAVLTFINAAIKK